MILRVAPDDVLLSSCFYPHVTLCRQGQIRLTGCFSDEGARPVTLARVASRSRLRCLRFRYRSCYWPAGLASPLPSRSCRMACIARGRDTGRGLTDL